MCNYVGYNYKHIKLDNSSDYELLEIIDDLNKDDSVSGILVQMPLPSNIKANVIQNKIDYRKDVDGLNDVNAGRLFHNKEALVSCTPYGIIKLLDYYNIPLEGKNVVIVGRSNLVGKPLFNLFLNRNSTVTLCHSKTKNLKSYTKNADILVVAVGIKHFITKDMIKENSTVIDVGINRYNDKLYGDVDFENVKDICNITPVPNGVGQMTIAALALNIFSSYNLIKGNEYEDRFNYYSN